MNEPRSTGTTQRLCVVVPCYNEEQVIEQFHESLCDELILIDNLDFSVMFVDDGSCDATLTLLNKIAAADSRVKVCSLSRNFGHQAALTAGLEHASGDAVLMMDCDLQHPPSMIPKMVEQWRQGHDVVSAVRRSSEGASAFKRFTSLGFYWLVNRCSETQIVPGAADFCLLSRRAHEALLSLPERHRFLRGMISWIGFPRAFVEFEAPPRAAGESKYTVVKMAALAFDALFSFTTAPIRLATRTGAAIIALGGLYLAYVLGRYFLLNDLVPGWSSLICTVTILGGMQLLFIGLIGQYLGRVYEESKQRPLYLLKQSPGGRQASRSPGPVASQPIVSHSAVSNPAACNPDACNPVVSTSSQELSR